MRYYAIIVMLLCITITHSQNCDHSLSGTVIDLHDGQILVGATLIIAGTNQAVQTDIDGRFSFSNLCNDTYSIQVSHPYCRTEGFTVKVLGKTRRSFRLEHHIEELNQITIEGKAFTSKSKTILENTLNSKDLERYSAGSLGDALNNLSGVSSLNTGNTVIKPLINGLHSSRVVIINNGVRLEDQEWGAEHAPNIDINTVGNLTLIKGAGALQYGGDAVGGVIIAEAAKVPVKDSLYGKSLMTMSNNGRGASLTSQLTKSHKNGWDAKIQGTLKRYGDFKAPNYVLSNTGFFERNLSLGIGLNRFNYGFEAYYSLFKNDIGILRASHLGGAQDQVQAIESDVPLIIDDFTYHIDAPKQNVTHHLAKIKGFRRFDNFGKLEIQYDFQRNNRFEFDIRRGDDKNKASLDLQLDTHTLLLDLDINTSSKSSFQTGLMASYQKNIANPETGVRRLIPDYDMYALGAYGIANFKLNEQWLLEVGGRFDYTHMDAFKFYRSSFWESRNYDVIFSDIVVEELDNQVLANPQLNFYNGSGTLGSTYSFGQDYQLFINYSIASRTPNPSDLFSEGLHHSASRIEIGDLRFDSEIGHKLMLSLNKRSQLFSYTINPFINVITDFIVIEPTDVRQTIRGNFQVWEYRQTNAKLIGIDVDASYSISGNFIYNGQLSLVKGYDRTRKEPLINMPPAQIKNEIVFQKNSVNNLRLSLESEYNFKQNEYPDNNFEVFIPEIGATKLVDVSTPPDAYHLLHFNSSIDFKTTKNKTLTVGLEIENLLNTSYRNYLNRFRYYADDLGRNFLINLKFNY